MGNKGSRLTTDVSDAADAFVARVATVGEVTHRKMFGGVGIFESGTMFALVDSAGSVCLRVSPETEAAFVAGGSRKHGKMPYYSLPADVLSDHDALLQWTRTAIDVAHAAKAG